MRPIEITPIPRQSAYLALSFLLPAVILGTVFALHKVYPFGGQQILVVDFWHQYYPLLSDYWHKLREGVSLQWSWTAGAGGNYLGLIAYIMASPLNLFIALFPHEWLREVLTVLLLVRIGFAGLFMSLYLRNTFGRCGLSLPIFASLYALCAFTLGYYWNIMWFDTFALLPLVMLGLQALVREGKFRLYTVSLALAVFTHYYIGFYTCIFVAIMFFNLCFLHKVNRREFFHKLGLIAVCSAVALGMTALLTMPA
ncbi:MAG: YfhO family protein, partial [Syntrophorhabdaceae bacterium]|nr:YfhO family protein [Syntrophorhabdaceae bacterium]